MAITAEQNPARRDGHDAPDWVERAAADIRDLNPDYSEFETAVADIIRGYLCQAHASPQGAWQAMESAPKDGTVVWLVEDGQPLGLTIPHQCMGYWEADKRLRSGGAWHYVDRSLLAQPTHWQPLPAPPAVRQEGEV